MCLYIVVGICFAFNTRGEYQAFAAGSSGGISFLMDAQTDEYFIGPKSYAEGFSVSIILMYIALNARSNNFCSTYDTCRLSVQQ